jgi:hypothetical protein
MAGTASPDADAGTVIVGIFCQILAELCGESSFPLEVGLYHCLVTRGNAVAAGQQATPALNFFDPP